MHKLNLDLHYLGGESIAPQARKQQQKLSIQKPQTMLVLTPKTALPLPFFQKIFLSQTLNQLLLPLVFKTFHNWFEHKNQLLSYELKETRPITKTYKCSYSQKL